MASSNALYHARLVHGGHAVSALDTGSYEVHWPGGSVSYPSKRQTLIALVNQSPQPSPSASDPKIPFARYFRIGRYELPHPSADTLNIFSPKLSVLDGGLSRRVHTDTRITILVPSEPTLGVDLRRRGHEVKKLFYAGFARRVLGMGYDPEEVLQEVFKGILIRNSGKCPFDVTKSSFGHYVHMVIGCILINYDKRWKRVYEAEQYGVKSQDGIVRDASESDLVMVDACQEHDAGTGMAVRAMKDEAISIAFELGADPDMTSACVEALCVGMKKAEIARELERHGARPFQIDRAYESARRASGALI